MTRIHVIALGLGLILGAAGTALAETDTIERGPDGRIIGSGGYRSGGYYGSGYQYPRARYRRDYYDGGEYPYGGYYNPYYAPAPRYVPQQRNYDRRRGRYVYDPAGGGLIRTR